jgi:hypothetical protein
MMIDINYEGKHNEEEVAENQLVAPKDAPRLGREENEQKISQMEEDNFEKEKAEKKSKNKCEIQGDGLDDAKEAIEINEVDVVRQDFACTSLKAKNKELEMLAENSFGIDNKDTSEAKDEAPKNKENSITYFTRQSSTKPEAVRRYVDPPLLNHCVQLLTPLSTPGPEKRDVKTDINPEGRDDDRKMAEKQGHE